jgi:lipopolysaccharide/colanic/teichoic acid biosynthesis glycosyltransferase
MAEWPQTDGFRTADFVRRTLDVVIAAAALFAVAPLLALIALAIRLDSPGPILYSQMRLGRYGRRFRLYKFRKFHDRASDVRALTMKNDPRMTRVGRWLERTKFDELPQFWNVLLGDMAVVGPRPESVAFADCFRGHFEAVLEHTPGLFGPNQVVFRNENSLFPPGEEPHEFYRSVLFPTKARIDLAYFRRRTLVGDLSWILRGAQVVLWSRSRSPSATTVMPGFETAPVGQGEKKFTISAPEAGE